MSSGVAVHPDDQSSVSTTLLLNQADDAMYEAKRAGKNAFRVTVVSAPAAGADTTDEACAANPSLL